MAPGESEDVSEGARATRVADLLALALEAFRAGLWEWDVTTGAVELQGDWYGLLGYPPGTLPARLDAWDALVHPEDVAHAHAALDAYVAGHTAEFETECRARAHDGTWRWLLRRGRALTRGPDGRPVRMAGVCLDVTARRTAEVAQRRGEATVRTLVQGLSDHAVYLLTPEGLISTWGAVATRLTGLTDAEAIGQHIRVRYSPEDVAAGVPEQELERARTEGRSQREGCPLCQRE